LPRRLLREGRSWREFAAAPRNTFDEYRSIWRRRSMRANTWWHSSTSVAASKVAGARSSSGSVTTA
jgi:hypothetical protein